MSIAKPRHEILAMSRGAKPVHAMLSVARPSAAEPRHEILALRCRSMQCADMRGAGQRCRANPGRAKKTLRCCEAPRRAAPRHVLTSTDAPRKPCLTPRCRALLYHAEPGRAKPNRAMKTLRCSVTPSGAASCLNAPGRASTRQENLALRRGVKLSRVLLRPERHCPAVKTLSCHSVRRAAQLGAARYSRAWLRVAK